MKKKIIKKVIFLISFFAALTVCVTAVLFFLSDNSEFEESFYRVKSSKVKEPVRVIALADLHNGEFGENNAKLVERITALKPDIIVMAGDMVNKDEADTEVCLNLCRRLLEAAPVYYVYGNHEGTMIYDKGIRLQDQLREAGVTILENTSTTIEVKENRIEIGGVSGSPELYEKYAADFIEEFEKKDEYKILLCHQPDLFYEKLAEVDADLSFAGHFHGGAIQIPGLGGLYAQEYGFFPKYCDGMFELSHGVLIVSRGLGQAPGTPRINNRPELVITDIVRG